MPHSPTHVSGAPSPQECIWEVHHLCECSHAGTTSITVPDENGTLYNICIIDMLLILWCCEIYCGTK